MKAHLLPTLIIIAGPNGAGKTTFAREYLAADERHFTFVNADEIARGFATPSDVTAARIMLTQIDELVESGANFVIETTLAGLVYARKISSWQQRGYLVSLVYLRLNSVEESIARVRKRVAAGGHGISDDIIRRRFTRSLACFENIYRPIVDEWYDWESGEGFLWLRDSWNGRSDTRS